ncbi:MAG TPA: LD-carboxypeptidase [Arachidicoccus soli]|nr:LD-carboxypeptidase [Arachidicoccus soli]
MIIPKQLIENDTIGIVCPSGFMPMEKLRTCIQTLQQWGFQVKIGKTLGHQSGYFSGTDEERLTDLQAMIDDKNVKAILCGRGGYGLSRIIDKINFTPLIKNPKWIIGYSDVTLLHCHLNRKIKIASLHSPMAGAFNEGVDNIYIQSLKRILTGKNSIYKIASHPLNRFGECSGELIGGNLAMLAHAVGSVSEPKTNNKILFIEDVGEYLYTIDRMLHQLKRSGWFDNLKGLLIGSFTELKDTTIPFGKTIDKIIQELVAEYNFPIAYNFPVGHQKENYALKCGVSYHLQVKENLVTFKEIK